MPNPARTAANPGLPNITRRSLLAAGPALGLAAGIDVSKSGPVFKPETPVMRMFRDWLAASYAFDSLPMSMSDAEATPFFAHATEIADRIVDLPSAGIGDFVLKLAAHTYCFEHDLSGCPGEAALLAELEQVVRELVPASAGILARFRSAEA